MTTSYFLPAKRDLQGRRALSGLKGLLDLPENPLRRLDLKDLKALTVLPATLRYLALPDHPVTKVLTDLWAQKAPSRAVLVLPDAPVLKVLLALQGFRVTLVLQDHRGLPAHN